MSAPTPNPRNPYQMAIGILALADLLIRLVLILSGQPGDSYYGDDGDPALVSVGAWLIGSGVLLGTAWLAVGALLWKPGPPRSYLANPMLDWIAPEPPR